MKSVLLLLGAMTAPACSAQVFLTVANAGFEDPFAPNGNFVAVNHNAFPSWQAYDPFSILDDVSDAIGVIMPAGTTYFPAGAPEGRNAALVFLDGGQTGEAGLQQTLAATLQPNTRYELSVAVGNIASGTGLPPSDQFGFFDLDGFPGYRIDIMAGTSVIASDNNSLSIPEGEFRTATLSIDVGAAHANLGENLGIRLVNLNFAGTAEAPAIEVDFDNVVFSATTVPEPAQIGLAAGASLAIFSLLRRRGVCLSRRDGNS